MPTAVILQTLQKILYSRVTWIIVALIILFLIVRKYKSEIIRTFQPSDIDMLPGESRTISASRKLELKDLASDLYSDIYDTPISGHTHNLYVDANNLSDNELNFMATYYRKNLASGTYLYTDIKNEAFSIFTDVDTRLKAHLSKVGESGE